MLHLYSKHFWGAASLGPWKICTFFFSRALLCGFEIQVSCTEKCMTRSTKLLICKTSALSQARLRWLFLIWKLGRLLSCNCISVKVRGLWWAVLYNQSWRSLAFVLAFTLQIPACLAMLTLPSCTAHRKHLTPIPMAEQGNINASFALWLERQETQVQISSPVINLCWLLP